MKTTINVSIILLITFFLASQSSAVEKITSTYEIHKRGVASLTGIKNFRLLSPVLASAGMPTPADLTLIKQNGYRHIINLIPGNYSKEQQQVTALDMSFDQIPVDWYEPKLANFQTFVKLMEKYQQDKTLIHCRLNYRASAFVYLYQITQLGLDETKAKQEMLSIWQPEGNWLDFISKVKNHYQVKQ
jgi:protein tyrosine phosphatase (PTP) superfamily phosphohydrolase (DUF442 family)